MGTFNTEITYGYVNRIDSLKLAFKALPDFKEFWYLLNHLDDDIEIDIDIDIHFDYQPYEPEVRYYPDGSGYPGCDAEISIYDITTDFKRFDFDSLTDHDIDELEQEIFEYLNDKNDRY